MAARQIRRIVFNSDIALVSDLCCRHPRDRYGYQEESEGDNIIFVRSGVFGRVIGKRMEIADSANVMFFKKGYSYRFFHPVDVGDICTIITPTKEFLLETFGDTVQDPQRLPFHLPPMLASPRAILLHGEFLATIRNQAPLFSAEETLTELLTITGQVAWGQTSTRNLRPTDWARRRRNLAEETKVLLNRSIENRPSLTEIAKILNCSKFYLSRVFTEECGIPIRKYFIRLRLQAAALRISEGASDLTNLALDLGFCDHSHLTKMFIREFGVQPSVFRVRASSKTTTRYKGALNLQNTVCTEA